MKPIAAVAHDLVDRRREFVLATIVERSGSAPRSSGSRMIVTADGAGYGTIGGGLLEGQTMAESRKVLRERRSRFLSFNLSFDDAASAGMICGGRVEVLLAFVQPIDPNRAAFRRWDQALKTGQNAVFVDVVVSGRRAVERVDHCLVESDGSIAGECPLPPDELLRLADEACRGSDLRVVRHESFVVVLEPCRRPSMLYLFGAGHVAQSTAHLAKLVGFRVTVLDDRSEFANAERFPKADAIRVLDDFQYGFSDLAIDTDSYVVIVTRGHLFDRVVLGQALKTGAGYIGMIGSRRKIDAVYGKLEQEGFTATDFDRVHAPIGLKIGAETPEEIAVSIVAELIQKRAELN